MLPPRPAAATAPGRRGRSGFSPTARNATAVGTADLVRAGAAPAPYGSPATRAADPGTSAGVAREVSGAGALLAPPVTLPPGSAIDQATDRGLLLTSANEQAGTALYTLWDPGSKTSGRTFDNVIAASATAIAWTSRCAPTTCRVQVLDLATGRATAITLPAGQHRRQRRVQPQRSFHRAPAQLRPRRRASDATRRRVGRQRPADGGTGNLGQQRRPVQLRLAGAAATAWWPSSTSCRSCSWRPGTRAPAGWP